MRPRRAFDSLSLRTGQRERSPTPLTRCRASLRSRTFQAARQRFRESVAVVVHTIGLPVFVTPRAPCCEQNEPGCTPWATRSVVALGFGLGVFGGAVVSFGVGGLVGVGLMLRLGDGVAVGLLAVAVSTAASGSMASVGVGAGGGISAARCTLAEAAGCPAGGLLSSVNAATTPPPQQSSARAMTPLMRALRSFFGFDFDFGFGVG